MVETMITRGISRRHQLHRPISVTSWAGLVSSTDRPFVRNFFAGDLQIDFSGLYVKSCARHSVDFVILGSPQWHHGGCVFGCLWLVNGERKCEEATVTFPARGQKRLCVT